MILIYNRYKKKSKIEVVCEVGIKSSLSDPESEMLGNTELENKTVYFI